MTGPPRVRFAPAPTGYLHVGSARAALFNWLFARQEGGTFVLRIEDTDAERSRPELVDAILDALRWLGLDWDEGPVRQSDRADLYADAADRLLSSGHAYRCDCTREAIDARAADRGGAPGYDGHCRDRGVQPGDGVVIRFRTPDDGATSFTDVIRGEVVFDHANIEDFVIVRSNGVPMFLLANAVDDADMGITHVIRGEDLVNVTPKVLLLRDALGSTERPVFAHLPLLVNERRQKLSKRRDDVSVGDYRDRGFLPEAMFNYLALLGWGPPDGAEIRPRDEIVALFRLEDVTRSAAFFDVQKLAHVNGEYIRALSVDEFVARSLPFLTAAPWGDRIDVDAFRQLAPEVQTRVTTLGEVPAMIDFLFLDDVEVDEQAWAKATKDQAPAVLDGVLAGYAECDWEAEAIAGATWAVAESLGLNRKKTQAPIRVAVTGRAVGPPLFESLAVLGRERARSRLQAARDRLG